MRVNLLPYELTGKRKANWSLVFTLLGIFMVAVVTAVFYLALQGRVNALRDEIAMVKNEYQNYTRAIERKSLLDQLQVVYSEKSGFINELSGEGVKWNLIMDEIRDIIPRTVVLDMVTNDGEDLITITGRAGSLQAISQYMINIQTARYVADPDLKNATWNAELEAFEFLMTCSPKGVSGGG